MTYKISIAEKNFSESKRILVESENMRVNVFRYGTGVCGLEIANRHGSVTFLPFQGQQVWRAAFCGHDITMKTRFDEPVPTRDFLSTYGGFLLHCGLTALGNPSEQDTHPTHGELPNAPYKDVFLLCGTDEQGEYMELTGTYRHCASFETDYLFQPSCRLYEGASVLRITVKITNLRALPLEYFYMCHVNFPLVDGSRLISGKSGEPVIVHEKVPETLHEPVKKRLAEYFRQLRKDPDIHEKVDLSTQTYNPEIVFTVPCRADAEGYAHAMQLMPDGYAHYVSHEPSELPVGIRWISYTGDECALGLLLPSTAEHKGYIDAVKRGFARYVGANETVGYTVSAGLLQPDSAKKMKGHIEQTQG